jgi:hypothetical protein
MRNTKVDQARFLATSDDFNRKPQHRLGFFKESRRIFRHAQGVGCHSPHGARIQPPQSLGKSRQGFEPTLLRRRIQTFVLAQAGGQPNRLLETIERIDLVADNTAHLKSEAVRAKVDSGNHFVGHGRILTPCNYLIIVMKPQPD